MLSTILPFLFISLIYYIPALLFISTAKLQYKNKSTYQNINSKTNGVQSFWVFVAYFFLIGLIGFTLCVLYIVTKKELIDDDFVLLLLTLIVPNIIQFINSLVFLPKYWNPGISPRGRENLLIIFFLSNIFYTFIISALILNTRSMLPLLLIISGSLSLPSFFLLPYLAMKEIKPDLNFTQISSGFKFDLRIKQLLCLLIVWLSLLYLQRELISSQRVKMGLSPERAMSISYDDLITDDKYILGEDENNNFIRDDYELWVEKNYIGHDEKMALLQYGQTHFRYMEATLAGMKKIKGKKKLSTINLEEEDKFLTEYFVRRHLFWAGACVSYVFNDEMNRNTGRAVEEKAREILINNKQRYDVDHISHFSGGGFNIPDYEGCSFLIKKDAKKNEIASKNLRNQFIVSIEKGDVEEINRTCKQIPITDLDDYMIAEISAAALLTQNEDILDTLFKCGIDFRKDFRDEIYGFSKKPYDIAKGLGAKKSLKWFESKYE